MKKFTFLKFVSSLVFLSFYFLLSTGLWAQEKHMESSQDSIYLPQIKIIADPTSYGPYYINTRHTNIYFVTDLPENTSKVTMKFIDSKGEQLGESHTKEGSNITDVLWDVEAEDVGFALSPMLSIEIQYQTDSVAIYKIPYIVYPDTVKFFATEGWGSFVTNGYNLSDDWQPVPELMNSFAVHNLPPRTDTLVFQLYAADSTVIDSAIVYANQGEYLDSAVFANVRMDSLPLNTRHLRTLISCEGGPEGGLEFHKELSIIPHQPKLVSKVDGIALVDSIGVFVENEFSGQALTVDSVKHAIISNGPGVRDHDLDNNTIYRGPYTLDVFKGDFTIESWMRFDAEKLQDYYNEYAVVMSVDSVWGLTIYSLDGMAYITLRTFLEAVPYVNEIFTAHIPIEKLMATDWHHIAITSSYPGSGYPEMNFYFDGMKWLDVTFHEDTYDLYDHINYKWSWKTQPLYLGTSPALTNNYKASYVSAMDEVRLWSIAVSEENIRQNYHKKILQNENLLGYWNFDDLRNHLGFISDLSFSNNTGRRKNGATFIPQYPLIQTTPDSIMFYSSNLLADSVTYSFIDHDGHVVHSDTSMLTNSGDTLLYDVSALPDDIRKLQISEYVPGSPDSGFIQSYNLQCLAPTPIATPNYNWNTFYYSANNKGSFYNALRVSGLPDNTTKVELGLKKGEDYFNLESSAENSIPYRYSLTLNGTDNYVETSQNIAAPEKFTLSLWFKTTTKAGGRIIGFTDSRIGSRATNDRELILRKDGSLRFYLKTDDSTYILSAVNKYDDGQWHDVTVVVDTGASLYLDGSLVDYSEQAHADTYNGRWIIGKNSSLLSIATDEEKLAEYFQGSICEVVINDKSSSLQEINANRFGSTGDRVSIYHYKFDEGEGTTIHDYTGNNDAVLKGSSQKWYVADQLSVVVWNNNVIDKLPGTYDFIAKVFYVGGPAEGAEYPLGRFIIKNPFPEHNFTYDMRNGFGYFNEGTKLINYLDFSISNTNSDTANWKNNFLKYKFLTPDHYLIDEGTFLYTEINNEGSLPIDMGDAPPGSYLSLEVGFHTHDGKEHITNQLAFALYFNPMLAPIVTGNFGPFDQAIAPGSMEQMNTFVVTTEILSDLNRVLARFYDKYDNFLGETDAVEQPGDTVWHITYDMGKLAPPVSKLKIEYFLGVDPHPALVQGPFAIHITKTRPDWFDFVSSDFFHDVQQTGDQVTFSVVSPFEKSFLINNSEAVEIPEWIPLIGGSSCDMNSPTLAASLKYNIPAYKLELDGTPDFFQKVFNLGAGSAETLRLGFNYSQNDTCRLDENNNLIATQNFSTGGSATSGFQKLENIAKKIKETIEAVKVADPETIIVSPSFSLTFAGQFQYASRENLKIDSYTGKWGSYGSLDIDANPDHVEAYQKSASYKFYSAAMGVEFSIGAELLEGLLGGYFGIDGRFVLGFGHAFTTTPQKSSKQLKSFAFQTYGRFYITALWGWYEKTVWGPKLFSSNIIWGDKLTNCFPPLGKKEAPNATIKANSSWDELADEVKPVRKFSKIPMPVPEPNIVFSNNQQLFTWVERGKAYGERQLQARYLDNQNGTFGNTITVELNNNALNNPIADAIDEDLTFYCWAQNRHDNKSILKVKPSELLKEFVKAQDIWFAIYDQKTDSIILMESVEDDRLKLNSGRAEANPVACVLTDAQVIITWQVADVDNHQSALWYLLLEKSGDTWSPNTPKEFVKIDGVATQLEIVSPGEGKAVVTWLNTKEADTIHNKVMTTLFDGTDWTTEQTLLDEQDNYYNYLTLAIDNGFGGLVITAFVEDSTLHRHEKVMLIPWDATNKQWDSEKPIELLVDTVNHLQLPQMTMKEDGTAIIAFKAEELILKDEFSRISQVDLLVGDLNNPSVGWKHIEANEYVCDTTKQLIDMQITFVNNNTLMLLANEYPMTPTNSRFEPINGKMFGDPYMNLVLRSFSVNELGEVHDVDEGDYFTGIYDYPKNQSRVRLYQNYPNPCNDRTTITFDIPENMSIKLELYDIKGNQVATLMDQHMNSGRYEISLNVSLLKPGTYIYSLCTPESTTALRMMVGN